MEIRKRDLFIKPIRWSLSLLILSGAVLSFANHHKPGIANPKAAYHNYINLSVSSLKHKPLPFFKFNPADIIVNQCGTAPITLPTAADPNFNNAAIIAQYPYGPTWSDGSSGSTFTATTSGTYYWQRTAASSVANSDFSSGDTGFISGYTDKTANPNGTNLYVEQTYAVGSNPNSYHTGFGSFGDHTTGTGKMLIVNGGPTAATTAWSETITIKANTDYIFAFWAANASAADLTQTGGVYNTSTVQFTLTSGGTTTTLGTIALSGADPVGVWQYFNTVWNSGSLSGTVTISLVDTQGVANGNDFAVDDINFAEIYRQKYNITMNAVPTLSVVSAICGVPSYNLQNTIIGYDPTTYTYTFKNSSGTTLSGSQITTAPDGTYTITETNNATGCTSASQNVTVTINPVPPLSVTSPISACGSYDLKNAINSYNATTYTYTYSSGSSVVSASGTYTITATNNVTGCTSSVPTTVTINPVPTFTATSPTLACGTASYNLSTAISGAGGAYTYTYQDSGGNTLGSSTVNTSGTYTIIATSGGCTTSHTVTVSFNPIPVVTVLSPVCITGGARYNLQNAVIGYDPTTYNYTFKKSGTTLSGSQITSANTSNNYTVTATNIATGCTSASAPIVVQTGTAPTFTVTSPTLACGTSSYNLSNAISGAGGAYTYTYMDSGGNTLGSSTVTTSGTYYIIATTAAGCETLSQGVTVTLKPGPTFTATNPTLACGVTSYDLSTAISGAGGTYTYTYKDSGGATLGSSTVTTAGTYTIIATNSATGCTTSKTVTVTFNSAPALTVISPQTACASFDLHSAINSPDPTVTYTYSSGASSVVTTSGTYTITASKNGCSTTANVTVTINPLPVLAVTSPPAQCGGTYDLKNAITGYDATTYNYTYSSGVSSVVSASGTYTITETNKITGCVSAPKSVIVTINAVPVLAVTSPSLACGVASYDLTSAVSAYNTGAYTYTFKDSHGNTVATPTNITSSDTYTITKADKTTGCPATPQTVTITFKPLSALTLNTPATQCGGSIDLQTTIASYDAANFNYTYSSGASSVVSVSGSYNVTKTDKVTGCATSANVTVTINPLPVLSLIGPHTACVTYNLSQTISGYDPTIYTYTYKDSSGTVVANPAAITQSGTYTITETNKTTGCTSLPQTTTVTIVPNPSKPGIIPS